MAVKRKPPVAFKGAPDSLVASADFVVPRTLAQAPEIELDGRRYPVHFHPDESGSCTAMRISLPPTTPAGKTTAVVRIDGKDHPVTIEIEPRARISAEPRALRLPARQGADATVTVEVANLGNAAVALVRRVTVNLRKADALKLGIHKAFKQTEGDFITRMIALGDALKAEAAADVAVAVEADFDALAAGERRSVKVKLRLPEHLDPSVAWTGSLELLGTSIPVTFEVAKDPDKRRAA